MFRFVHSVASVAFLFWFLNTSVALEQLPRGVVLQRTIIYMRANNQGTFDPLDRKTYAFYGRSLFHLTGDLANQLRENFHQIMLCVRAGSQGRLTPLVIDLPADEQPMEIVVFTTGSQGESLAVVSVAYAAPVICLCSHGRRSAVQVIISMIIEKQGTLNTAVL